MGISCYRGLLSAWRERGKKTGPWATLLPTEGDGADGHADGEKAKTTNAKLEKAGKAKLEKAGKAEDEGFLVLRRTKENLSEGGRQAAVGCRAAGRGVSEGDDWENIAKHVVMAGVIDSYQNLFSSATIKICSLPQNLFSSAASP